MREAARVFAAVGRNRSLRRELGTFLVFNACEWGTWVAILVYAYDRWGSAAMGGIAVVQLVPAIFVAPVGSILGDKLPRGRALALGFGAQSVAMALTAAVLRAGLPLPVVYVCAALANCSVTLTRPVHYALLPQVAETPPELTAANSVSGMLEGLAVFVGPLPAAALLTRWGAWSAFAVAAVLLAVSCAIASTLRIGGIDPRGSAGSMIQDSLEGFRELRREHAAALLTVLVGASFVVIGMLDILTVVLALGILGMDQAGPSFMTAAIGIGSLAGAAATAVLVGRRRLVPALATGIVVTGLPLVLVALARAPLTAAALLFVSGAGEAFFAVAGRTLLQRTVDEDVLARVFGLQEAMLMAGLAVGAILAPALVRVLGPRGAFVGAGLLLPIAGLLAWPRLRRVDASAEVPRAELKLIRTMPIFAPLPPHALEQLARDLQPMRVSSGTVLMREGEVGDRFYIVAEGELEVAVAGRAVAWIEPGGYVGEIALLRDVPRTATVVAATDCRLLALERDDFLVAVTGSRAGVLAAHAEIDRRLEELGPSQNRNNPG